MRLRPPTYMQESIRKPGKRVSGLYAGFWKQKTGQPVLRSNLLMKQAENLDDIFLAMELFLRDIIVYKNTPSRPCLYNGDKIVEIKRLCADLSSGNADPSILGRLQAAA